MEIKSVALLGAGAVGSYIIWGLSGKEGIEFSLCAEGARRERLEREGVRINGTLYRPAVRTPQELHNVDLLIVTLKYGALQGALGSIKTIVGENTTVISLMNGVDSEDRIAAEVGQEHLLYSIIKIASHRESDGFHFDPDATIGIIFGELSEPFESERVKAVKELFAGTGINIRSTQYAREEIWRKFRLNICNNLPQAILGVGVGCYRDSEHMSAIREGLRKEVNAVAAAKGIDMNAVPSSSPTTGVIVPPGARYSTLQDIDAGRHTEIDMFSGVMIQLGKELGIPVPYNEYTYHMIKAIEEKNDGLFDYHEDDPATAAD